jgi:hypothetical protein
MIGIVLATAAGAAYLAPMAVDVEATFDDGVEPMAVAFNDFDTQATGTGKTWGTEPGFHAAEGMLVFYDNSNFGDVGVATFDAPDAKGKPYFNITADVTVKSIDFTKSKIGLFAFAQGPGSYNQGFSGLFAYVQELDTSGNNYRFVLTTNADEATEELAASGDFNLTDGSNDFSLQLTGTQNADGDYEVVARLIEGDDDRVRPLEVTVAAAELPQGEKFGIRVNPGFNTLELGFDNVVIQAGEVPEAAE